MDNMVNNSSVPVTENEVIFANPPRSYSKTECIIAWISLFCGYIFCRVFPVVSNPLGGFIFVFVLFVAGLIFLNNVKSVKLGAPPLMAFISAVIVAFSLLVSSNPFLNFISYSYALAAFGYFIYSATGNNTESGFSNFIVMDFIKALFVLPFYSLGSIFLAMFSQKTKGNYVLKILLGLVLAIVPTAIILSLLSYDSGFSELLNNIFDFNWGKIFSHIGSLILGIPVGMYGFGLCISSVDKKGSEKFNKQTCQKTGEKLGVAPALTVISAVAPLLFVYIVFFISQWGYYTSGFTGVLPEEFSYAEYAREGFFQLCTVSVINFLIITAIVVFIRRSDNNPPVLLKVLTIIFSVFTLILISTAIAKMVMYISFYGLTPKRVYATWFMLLLAIIFIFASVHQFVPKLKLIAISLCICVGMFAILSLSNVDGMIAKYNVNRYISGNLESVDVFALDRLGNSAVPEMVRLEKELKNKQETDIITEQEEILYSVLSKKLNRKEEKLKERDVNIFEFNIPAMRAEKALNSR